MSANHIDFTAAEREALDRATVPALRASFAADLVAAAVAGTRVPPRRSARGGWRGHGRVLIGAGALLIASATAAATGWFGKLPIAIPGITRTAAAPEISKPKHLVRAEKPRPAVGRAEKLAALPEAAPIAASEPLPGQWQRQRQARIAAGLPVRRPLVRRALMAEFRGMPAAQRQAAIAEWRRIRALPPADRKVAIAKLKADYLATHPRVAARVEKRLENRSALAASAGDPPKAGMVAPVAPGLQRADRFGRLMLSPQERFERRRAWREWRMQRRALRLQSERPLPGEGPATPER